MNEIIVNLEGKEVIIKKLPIGRYAELIKQLKKLPKHVQSLPNLDNATIVENLPTIIEESQDDLFGLISVATELKIEDIKVLGLNEVVDLVIAVIEVNQYKEVFEKIKKLRAHPQEMKKK